MSFSIRLTEKEKELAESYARLHSQTLSEAFKCDIAVANEAYKAYVESGKKSLTFDEAARKLGL